jgi:hypothetical protein
MLKACTKCNIEKSLDNFHKSKREKDGLNYWCKTCVSNYCKEYNQTEERKKVVKEYKEEYNKTEKHKKYVKEYNDANREKYADSEKNKEYSKKYANSENGKLVRRNLSKEYAKTNKRKEYIKNYLKTRRDNDPLYKLKTNIKAAILSSIKKGGYKKESKTNEILGCTFEEFKIHLESKFEPWMSWDNYGVYNGAEKSTWQIDHIIPISSAKTQEDIVNLNHYKNLQPLDSYINLVVKKNKI